MEMPRQQMQLHAQQSHTPDNLSQKAQKLVISSHRMI